jgi:DNA-binding response OmpR family regulator
MHVPAQESTLVPTTYTDDLQDCAILPVEDEAITAIDTKSILEMAGAKVIGPAYSLRQGFHWLADRQIDCAVLDINLNDGLVFGLADLLDDRNVPIVFLSAHSLTVAPPRYRDRRLVHKPFGTHGLIGAIRGAISEHRKPSEARTA